ncbi:hypothetical protein NNC19_13245 [Clostridium sp. SHJSY1]|nr:hypothetical protein [Clostridium sp. SHJSY1]
MYILQYYQYPQIILKGLDYRLNFRFDKPRLYVGTILFSIAFFLSFTKLIFGEKSKFKSKIFHVISCVINILVLVIVIKTRTIVISLTICAMILVFIKIKNSKFTKSIIFVVCCVPISISLLNSTTIQNMLELTQNNDLSISARVNEIEFYKEQFTSNPIMGRGEVHKILFSNIDGNAYKMYLDDLGIMGFFVKFGLIGAFIILLIIFKIINICKIRTKIKTDKYFIIIMFIYLGIVGLFIPYLDFPDSILYISIVLAYADNLKLQELR